MAKAKRKPGRPKGKRGPGRPPGSGPGPMGPSPVTVAIHQIQSRYKSERRKIQKRIREVEREFERTIDTAHRQADSLSERMRASLVDIRAALRQLRPAPRGRKRRG